jgi:hypothetical protein
MGGEAAAEDGLERSGWGEGRGHSSEEGGSGSATHDRLGDVI